MARISMIDVGPMMPRTKQKGRTTMTTAAERIALASEKVLRWQTKRDHATAMLGKWEAQLKRLQPKPQPTAAKLPALTIVPGSVRFMPRGAVKTKGGFASLFAITMV